VVLILESTPVWLGVPLVIATVGAIFWGLRFLFSQLMRRQQRKARDLLARLEQIVSESSTAPPQPLPEQAAHLDASLLDETVPEKAPAQPASRTRTSSS
jgi:hypothetical protein